MTSRSVPREAESEVFDDVDVEILTALERDCRQRLVDIGSQVGLSASAVKRRIDRLETAGAIVGYSAVVDHAKLGWRLEAFTEVRMIGNTPLREIEAAARALPEVLAVYVIAGDPDALIHLRVRDVAHLRRAIDQLRTAGRVTGTKTLIVMDTWNRVVAAAASEALS